MIPDTTVRVRRRARDTVARAAADDGGWVLVPVVVLLVIALGLGMALLLLVDRQSEASGQQRDMDAAQALAEGVATSAANVLARPGTGADWTTPGCRTMTGRLTGSSVSDTAPAGLAGRIETAARAAFADDGAVTAYRTRDRTATWTVRLCPTVDAGAVGTDMRFNSDVMRRANVTGAVAGRRTLWVHTQADIVDATGHVLRSRSVAAKVEQDAAAYTPPSDVAIATGSFSAGLAGGAANLLNGGALGNAVLGKVLGTTPVVTDVSGDPAKARIGIRCDLLNGLSTTTNLNPDALNLDLCVSATLAGTNSLVTSLGLGAVGGLLGTNRFASLNGWSSTTPDAIAAYREEALQEHTAGVGPGALTPLGYGDVRNRDVTGPARDCLSGAQWDAMPASSAASSVVFIDRVGDGNQYCDLSGDHAAKIFVVARGGVRVTGRFRGVVYALNLNECDTATRTATDISSCSPAERQAAVKREVVRVDAGGQVRGAVWADGAKAQVGIYPAQLGSGATVSKALLDTVTGTADNRLCQLQAASPVLEPLATAVGTLLTGVGNLLGTVLGGLAGGFQQTQSLPAGSPPPVGDPPARTDRQAACDALSGALRGLSATALANGLGLGGHVAVDMEGWGRYKPCVAGICGAWRAWEVKKTSTASVLLPGDGALLDGILGVGSTLTDVATALTSTLTSAPPAVVRDPDVLAAATVSIASDAAFVPGTFRSVPPNAPPTGDW